MHIDLNSCFATIEQQANPLLRGKPLGVAAYDSPNGCIVAPSIEAKAKGVRVGMRVKEGKLICPNLQILPPDPVKYRIIHLKLKKLLKNYTEKVFPKSIDEFELDLEGYPAYNLGIMSIGKEIKERIKSEIGDWLTVSIGFGSNKFTAKTAANLHKPDGLDDININNYKNVYKSLKLTNLSGIAEKNAARLNASGIHTVWDMYTCNFYQLWEAFHSIIAYYWYLRLRGWEIDDVQWGRKSFGNTYSLPIQHSKREYLTPILTKLVDKMSYRLRQNNYACQGVHYAVSFTDGTHWHKGMKTKDILFSTQDIYKKVYKLFIWCPYTKPVRNIAVSVFNLKPKHDLQLNLYEDSLKKEDLYNAIDSMNERWGRFVITPARMVGTNENVQDRIAFGGVQEIYDFITQ
jgi:DNA polymerase-4